MPPQAHAKYGPSSMARIIACPGSIKLAEQMPRGEKESPYAAEGTDAHNLAEAILLEEPYKNWPEHDKEMVAAVQHYTDYCDELLNKADHYGIEAKLFGDDELFGTADCWALTGRTLYVVDYKHGAGVVVLPEENKQALTYAGLIFMDPKSGVTAEMVDIIHLVIVQPRTQGIPVKDWQTDTPRVQEHMKQVDAAITSSKLDVPPITMGDHCRWCKAKLICPAIRAAEEGIAAFDINDIEPLELARMLDAIKPIQAKINEILTYSQERIESGARVPGWKLVDKIARRSWSDEAAVMKWAQHAGLVRKITTPKLKTPLQATKSVPDKALKRLESFIEKKSSGLTIAPESDKRKEVQSIVGNLAAVAQLHA